MPRAQTSSKPIRLHTTSSPLAQKPPSERQQTPPDVIELTSSDTPDFRPRPRHKSSQQLSAQTTKKKQKQKSKAHPLEVIEISSDEDGVSPSQESLADLRIQVKRLKEESVRLKRNCSVLVHRLAQSRAELKEVKAKASKDKPTEGKLVLDLSQLEDGLSCEICTGRMYTPYLLPDCGHTFCLSCLQSWFGSIHARFIQAHPQWNANAVNAYVARIQGLLRPEYLRHPNIYNHLRQMQHPHPEYTCPTCRKRVVKRPAENYALKSFVRSILVANEAEKGDIPTDKPLTERQHGNLVVVDPWEGYFPKEMW